MHCNTLLQGWGDLGENCLHAAEVPGAKAGMIDKETTCDTRDGSTITPHMDSLAKGGMRFTDFHAGAAVCAPSRAVCGLQMRGHVVVRFAG